MSPKYTPEKRLKVFLSRIDKSPHPTSCWLWTGSKNQSGYGNIWWDGKCERAHRILWKLENGEIPDGFEICHSCDNPSCVNPDHLFLGTRKDNMQDMMHKGRGIQHRNEKHGNCKFSDAVVAEIRRLYEQGDVTQQSLADRFGVSHQQISNIVNYRMRV